LSKPDSSNEFDTNASPDGIDHHVALAIVNLEANKACSVNEMAEDETMQEVGTESIMILTLASVNAGLIQPRLLPSLRVSLKVRMEIRQT